MKVHIFGASGSGTTILGKSLEQELGWKHLDADDYYWEKTDPPFQIKVPLPERNAFITKDIEYYKNVIVSGSMGSWGKQWETAFDLAVFLYVPPKIRIERLKYRESERYGTLLQTNAVLKENSEAFMDWAKKYDDESFEGRSLALHNQWIKQLKCPVLRIEGDTTIPDRVARVVAKIASCTQHF